MPQPLPYIPVSSCNITSSDILQLDTSYQSSQSTRPALKTSRRMYCIIKNTIEHCKQLKNHETTTSLALL